jgi:hypothetical protein
VSITDSQVRRTCFWRIAEAFQTGDTNSPSAALEAGSWLSARWYKAGRFASTEGPAMRETRDKPYRFRTRAAALEPLPIAPPPVPPSEVVVGAAEPAHKALTLVLTPVPQQPDTVPEIRTVAPGQVLIIGTDVRLELLDPAVARYVSSAHEVIALDLGVEAPSRASAVQLVVSNLGDVPVIYSVGSQPVRPQPWAQPLRRSPVAGFPTGDELHIAQTFYLPECGPPHRRWGWQCAIANPNAKLPAPAPGPLGTDPEVVLKPLESSQLDALLVRFGSFFHFPATPNPKVLPYAQMGDRRKAVEKRLERLRDGVRRALDNDDIGTGEELLAELVDRGAIRFKDVAARAAEYGLLMRGAESLVEMDDPRPGVIDRIHPETRDLTDREGQ